MRTASLLNDVGTALYGPRWFSPLAEALGVNNRSIRRWVTGECEPSQGVWRDLEGVVRNHVQDLERWQMILRFHHEAIEEKAFKRRGQASDV